MEIVNNDEDLVDHSDMYILDFEPSLKTLCIDAVHKNNLDVSPLPVTVK